MVSNSKDDRPNKGTPATSTGVATNPPATIATTRHLVVPSESYKSV